MAFDSISLSHDPLLDVPIDRIHPSPRIRRYSMVVTGISLMICFLLLSLSLVFLVTRKQQRSSAIIDRNLTRTSTSTRSNELKTASKHQMNKFQKMRGDYSVS